MNRTAVIPNLRRARPLGAQLAQPTPDSAASVPPLDFQARAVEAANLLKALANPDRLLLLCQLVGGECSVSDLGALVRIEQPTLSQQLGVLRHEGLVGTRREGKNVFYQITAPAALAMLQTLHSLFCEQPTTPTVRAKRARPHKDTA